jgi:hypothetical protein
VRKILAAAILAMAVTSCEKESGTPVDVSLTSPYVTGSLVVHDTINLDDTSSTSHVVKLPNGKLRVTDTLFTQVSSPLGFGDIAAVSFKLYAPGETGYFAQGYLTFNGNHPTPTSGEYQSAISFDVQRSDAGKYVVEITADNRSGNGGNASLLSLFLTRNNIKPNTWGLIAPDTLFRPTTGYQLIRFAISAYDSDGYRDLEQVYLKRILPSASSIIPMFDDGDEVNNGDPVAGDGTFSRILRIDNTAILGQQVFLFQARDRSGALSDTLLHTITIVQGP